MIQVTRRVLIAAVAGVVAICAIAVAVWRLSWVGEPPARQAEMQQTGAEPPAPPANAPVGEASSAAGAIRSTGADAPPAAAPSVAPAGAQSAAAPSPMTEAAAPQSPAAPATKPSFDVVRIDPTGDAVVAGRAEPRTKVALTLSGKPIAQAETDSDGQFVMLPPKLPPGDHVLALRVTGPAGETVSEQTVTVAVPATGGREAVAALTEPNKPTVVLSQSGAPAGSARSPDLRIASVEAQQGGALYASGVAPPGSSLRLYLNESFVASVEAGQDGKWSIRVERGMSPGAYRVRADRVGQDGRAAGRVEAPFDYPAELAKAGAAAPSRAAPAQESASGSQQAAAPGAAGGDLSAAPEGKTADAQNVVVEELRTARVERGDSLWRISRSVYGEGIRYTQIYDANTSQIRNPDLIYPGQVLVVPKQDGQKARN